MWNGTEYLPDISNGSNNISMSSNLSPSKPRFHPITVVIVTAIISFHATQSALISSPNENATITFPLFAPVDDVTRTSSCLAYCTCMPTTTAKGLSLVIDCVGRRFNTEANSSSLNEEVDKLLTGRETELTQLTITNSSMQLVPSSICRLSRLVRLVLNLNRLTKLPERCLNNLVELEEFQATSNFITMIQEGVLDGMQTLQLLNLQYNNITTIGLHVFTADSGLISLRVINLRNNLLTELEPWPLIRGQLVPSSFVDLYGNRIVKITNRLGWGFRCGTKPPVVMKLNLEENPLKHVFHLTEGWNIPGFKFCNFISRTQYYYSAAGYAKIGNAVEAEADSFNHGLASLLCLIDGVVRQGTKQTHSFKLEVTMFTCDCQDFVFYELHNLNNKISFFDDNYCMEPQELYMKEINTVPLDKFVCVVESPVCPERCECIKTPYNRTYIVRSRTVNSFPKSLPDTRHPGPYRCRYDINFAGSKLDVIEARDYFKETIRLNVSGSSINHITDGAWRSLVKVKFIDFSFNHLTVLPKFLLSENITFNSLALYGNPWRCHCEDRWIRTWMTSLGTRLIQPESVLCDSNENPDVVAGKNILKITDEQFCYNPARDKMNVIAKTAVPTAGGSILLVVLLLTAIYRYRVSLFIRFNLHPFDVDECQGEDKLYDVFLSCAYEDREVGQQIVDRLEQGDVIDGGQGPAFGGGYKVCYHERDFIPGSLITDNIQMAIEQSKRVVCLLTCNFLRSDYCMMEFRAAWNQCLRLRKRRLVVVKWHEVNEETLSLPQPTSVNDDVPLLEHHEAPEENPDENLDSILPHTASLEDVKLFLSTHTYIEFEGTDWWQQLIYALPTSRSLQP